MTAREKMRLATAAMGGDRKALAELGLGENTTLGELDAIMRDALDAMTPAERAQDLASTELTLDSIASGRGRA